MSGNAACSWAVSSNVVQCSKAMAKKLGCPHQNSAEMIQGLLTKPAKRFEKNMLTNNFDSAIPEFKFAPRIDDDFLPKSVVELRKEAPKKNCLIGTAEVEALLFGNISTQLFMCTKEFQLLLHFEARAYKLLKK
jgi:hypothetical protein